MKLVLRLTLEQIHKQKIFTHHFTSMGKDFPGPATQAEIGDALEVEGTR
jgi:hypothetical protein